MDKDQAKLEDLHKSIRACDEILNSVETNLTSFRNDLGLVSADIENLQSRSTALNVRLDNRKAVEKGLFPAVDDLSVSPDLVNKIVEGHIDEQWVQCLKEVDKRTASLRSSPNVQQSGDRQQGSKVIKAATDLLPLLDKLVLKVGCLSFIHIVSTLGSVFTNAPSSISRQLSEYETSSSPRSRHCGHHTSMRRLYSSRVSSSSKTSLPFCTNTMPSWPTRSASHT